MNKTSLKNNIRNVIPRALRVNVPEIATKVLKARRNNDRRVFTVSSNLLPLFGFHGEARVVEEVIAPGKGFRVRLATADDVKRKKVYVREYKSRSANPLKRDAKRIEQQIETSSQKLIELAMGDAEHAHITFRNGEITFVPVTTVERQLLQDLDKDDQINTLVAMTGGVDCAVLDNSGFRVDAVVEYRPQEKRDNTDYTETTALNALVNSKPKVLCNEDIYHLDASRLTELLAEADISSVTMLHASLECSDYSTLKTKKQKADSTASMDSTLDMFVPVLNLLDQLNSPVLMVENVPGFLSSPINDVFTLQLRRRGYQIHQRVFDARDYGGNTSRKRLYLVATALDADFQFPEPSEYTALNVWQDVIEPNLPEIMQHDLTDTKVMQDALRLERARVITKEKPWAPTLTKAQGQATKDAVVVEHNGRYYKLPLSVQQQLNELPSNFDVDWLSVDKAEQLIGQSISCSLHHKIAQSVRDHIYRFHQQLKSPQNQLELAI